MHTDTIATTSYPRIAWRASLAVTVALLVTGLSHPAFGQQPQAKTFTSAGEAGQALYQAVVDNDEQTVRAILGAGPELTSSGDEAVDKLEREQFARKYQEMHRFVREPDGSTVLYIGAENWPFPIPLVTKNGSWHFDADAGAQEIKARKIGENETIAIQVCQDLGKAAQPTAAQEGTGDPALAFARKLAKNNPGAAESFNGYKFRIGSQQSAGVVVVASPVEYRVSGVKTFVVLPGGAIYEKDLGSRTDTLAPQINGKPSGKWKLVQ